jgi:hypothetical protein
MARLLTLPARSWVTTAEVWSRKVASTVGESGLQTTVLRPKTVTCARETGFLWFGSWASVRREFGAKFPLRRAHLPSPAGDFRYVPAGATRSGLLLQSDVDPERRVAACARRRRRGSLFWR